MELLARRPTAAFQSLQATKHIQTANMSTTGKVGARPP
jgi:hypothetical protein